MARTAIQGRWRPAVEVERAPERFRFAPRVGDRYVVVDDIEAGRAVVISSPWPDVDRLGHLVFPDDAPDADTTTGADADAGAGATTSQDFALPELQAAVDQQRAAAGQPAPDRPLRVGDVFWVRPPTRDGGAVDRWRMLDVTRAARRAARAALLVAANPDLRIDSPAPMPDKTLAETADEPDQAARQPPPSGAAQAAV